MLSFHSVHLLAIPRRLYNHRIPNGTAAFKGHFSNGKKGGHQGNGKRHSGKVIIAAAKVVVAVVISVVAIVPAKEATAVALGQEDQEHAKKSLQ